MVRREMWLWTFALLGLSLLGGCVPSMHHGAPAYQFRQPLLESSSPLEQRAPRVRQPTRSTARRDLVARCLSWEGRPLSGSQRDAEAVLLRECIGEKASRTVLASAVNKTQKPLPGDVVRFVTTAQTAPPDEGAAWGVVVNVQGPRVTFLYVLAARVRRGVLSLEQPHRRRLPKSRTIENSYVRIKRKDDPPRARYLAGQLLAGFVSPPDLS